MRELQCRLLISKEGPTGCGMSCFPLDKESELPRVATNLRAIFPGLFYKRCMRVNRLKDQSAAAAAATRSIQSDRHHLARASSSSSSSHIHSRTLLASVWHISTGTDSWRLRRCLTDDHASEGLIEQNILTGNCIILKKAGIVRLPVPHSKIPLLNWALHAEAWRAAPGSTVGRGSCRRSDVVDDASVLQVGRSTLLRSFLVPFLHALLGKNLYASVVYARDGPLPKCGIGELRIFRI